MNYSIPLTMLALASVSLGGDLVAQSKKPKIKPSVTYAKTWDAAVEEAKLLKLPIVVHSHGFY
ncbi:MAG: hypothetical protein H6832_06755 [Planctomycetes bacterium]|nr:hypothetical protein [Planctomycetota bacterium]MCB9890268.1 hypothetical protein [Planctomycetota bacterium]MCB9918086.1 hypothetical protein [Planctomycetota bacterium]